MATTITYTGVDGGSFINVLVGPAPGVGVTAASIGLGLQGAANNFKWGVNHWVNGVDDGSTWPGSITFSNLKKIVVVGTASNTNGITSTGVGTGSGVTGTGGSSGVGVSGTGGSGAPGILGQGGAGSHGGQFTGGSSGGLGVKAIGGADGGYALEVSTGNAVFTGAQPASGADPGADNYACPTNLVKAWGTFEITLGTPSMVDDYSVDSVAVDASVMTVTLARPMANSTYSVTLNARSAVALACPQIIVTGTSTFTVSFLNSTTGALIAPNGAGTSIAGTFHVCGRQ